MIVKIVVNNVKDFLYHIQYSYTRTSVYKCGLISCPISFSSFDSFRKHLGIKHVNFSMTYCEITDDINSSVESASTSNNPAISKEHLEEQTLIDVNDVIYFQDLDTGNINSESSETVDKSQAKNMNTIEPSVMFAAKLHNYLDRPWSRVKNTVNYVDKFIFSALNGLKDDVFQATLLDNEK